MISSKTTNDNGYFEFANLLPGKYQIKEVQPKYIDGKDTLGTIGERFLAMMCFQI